jgi:hypothetical protein
MKHQDTLPSAEEAAEELKSMTPEEYVDLMAYVQKLEQGLPEAPASINFRMTMPTGDDVMFTMRDWNENQLYIRFSKFIEILKAQGATPQERDSTTISNDEPLRITSDVDHTVIDGQDVEVFEVSSLTYMFTNNGTPYVNVKGGVWKKYGWRAYTEIIPPELNVGTWTVGEERKQVPPELKYAYVDKTKKKIVAFAA